MYINKQTTVKVGFNLNSVRNLKNIFPSILYIDFMSSDEYLNR